MKKSLRIFQLLVGLVLFVNVGSTAYSIYQGDNASAIGSASMMLFAAPVMGASALTVKHKDSEWKKTGPVAFLVIQQPGANAPTIYGSALQNPIINGYGGGNALPAPPGGGGGAGGVSMGSSGMATSNSEQLFADFSIGRALSFSFTFGTTYAGGVVPLLPQYTSDVMPTGVTFSSDGANFDTYAKFVNYFCKFPTLFNKLTVTADDTANFDKSLRLTRTNPDGNTEAYSATWNRLAIDPYAQVQTIRTLNKTFISGSDMRYELVSAVIPSSGTKVLNFVFEIVRVANSFNFIAPRT